MKTSRRSLPLLLIAFILLMFTATGCQGIDKGAGGKSTVSEQAATEKAAKEGDTVKKLVVWGGVPAENGPESLIEDWNKRNPNVQAEYVRFVNDDTGNAKLDTALMAGEPIDVYFSYSMVTLINRINASCAEELGQHGLDIFIDEQLGGIADGALTKVDGKLYYLPTNYTSHFVFINKKLADEKNVKIPEEWTIDEFREIAKKLTVEKSDGTMQYGTFNVPNLWQIEVGSDFWYKADGTSNFDDPLFKESLELYKTMMEVDKSTFPYKEVLARNLQQYRHDLFINGEFAMMIDEGASVRTIKDINKYPHDWITAFAPTPVPDKGKQYNWSNALYFYSSPGVSYGNFIMMNPKSTNKPESVEFLKYFITDGSIFMASAGKVPVCKDSNTEEAAKRMLGPSVEIMKLFDVEGFTRVCFDKKSSYVVSTNRYAGLVQITQILKEEVDKYFLGEQSIDQCVASMKKRADEAIKATK